MKLSVILCTHNPRPEFLRRTLAALQAQSLELADWELLLIDNASTGPLAATVSLAWHPHARHVREEQLGLTPARLRGIAEAAAPLLVFVDDDNLLDAGYLEEALRLDDAYPNLGAWGAGIIAPEYEQEPPAELRPFMPMLALRHETRAHWSNELKYNAGTPVGAGMCCRQAVARRYADETRQSPVRQSLDRRGDALSSSGDIDLALTACAMDFGVGVFPSLRLVHIIPVARMRIPYLLKLAEARIHSSLVLHSLYGHRPPPPHRWGERIRRAIYFLRLSPLRRRFYLAERQGERRALQELSSAS